MVSNARKTAYPDATTLIALATEMAVSVKTVAEGLTHFGVAPASHPIAAAIRRVGDTARILSLRGISIMADEIATLAKRVEESEVPNTAPVQEALRSAITSLHRYLQGAAAGKVSAGLVIHPAYLEIMAFMPDRRTLNRQEMFLPVSVVYGSNSPTYSEGKFIAEIARYHDEYHQAMVQFKVQRTLDNINAMRTALVTMETKNPPAEFRLLFSLVIGFFDVCLRNGAKIEPDHDELLGRIDEELAGVVRGEVMVDEATVSWFMHAIAAAPQFSTRIRGFQDLYDLARLADEDVMGEVSAETLDRAQTAVLKLQKTWEAVLTTGADPQPAKASALALLAACTALGDYSLKTMAMAIGSLADGVASAAVPATPEMAVFGASIILAISDRLSRIQQDPRGGRAIAEFHRERVRAVLAGKSLSDQAAQMPAIGEHSHAILDEVINNVSASEQIVDQCLREGVKEHKVKEALKLFSMSASALMLLNLMEGANLAQAVQADVEDQLGRMLQSQNVDQQETLRLAEAVMLLGRYIRLVLVDPSQAAAALNKAMSLYAPPSDKADESDAEPVAQTELCADLPFDICEDEELGPIFFEEAKDVIGNTILPGLSRLRSNLGDEHAMLEVRRGFHTLKGSARMVELTNLGMLGQYAEYSLNICRDDKNVKMNQAMIEWLESLAHEFSGAIGKLEEGHRAQVNVAAAEAVYKRFSDSGVFTSVAEVPSAVAGSSSHPIVLDEIALDVAQDPAAQEPPDVHIPETSPFVSSHDAEEPVAAVEMTDLDLSIAEDFSTANQVEAQEVAPAERPAADLTLVVEPVAIEILPQPAAPVQPEADAGQVLEIETQPVAAEPAAGPAIEPALTNDAPLVRLDDEASDQPDVEPSSVPKVSESSRDIFVGNVAIPNALYGAFVSEARKFYNELEAILVEMLQGKRSTMDREVMRFAHSLAGMGRTTGLTAITEVACELEAWASVLRDHRVTLNDDQKLILRDALEALEAMIMGVEDQLEPLSDPDLVQRLKTLVAQAEHVLAMGQDEKPISEDVLQTIADGGAITDEPASASQADPLPPLDSQMIEPAGESQIPASSSIPDIPLSIAQTDVQVLLDVSAASAPVSLEAPKQVSTQTESQESSIAPSLPTLTLELLQPQLDTPLSEVSQTTLGQDQFPSTVAHQITNESDEPHVIGDTVDSAAAESSIVEAVVAEVAASSMQIALAQVDSLSSEEIVAPELPVSVIAPVQSAADASGVDLDDAADMADASELPEIPPTIIESSFSISAPGESDQTAPIARNVVEFVAPDLSDAVELDVEVPAFPQSIEVAPAPEPELSGESVAPSTQTVAPIEPIVPMDFVAPAQPALVAPAPADQPAAPAMPAEHSSAPAPAAVAQEFMDETAESAWLEAVKARTDDVDPEMLDIFLEEAEEAFGSIDKCLSGLLGNISDRQLFLSLKRAMHTLKGSSNTAGARKVGAVFHHMEDLMNEAPSMTMELARTLQNGVDAAFAGIEAMKNGRSVQNAIERSYKAIKAKASGMAGTGTEAVAEPNPESNAESTHPSTNGLSAIAQQEPVQAAQEPEQAIAASSSGASSTSTAAPTSSAVDAQGVAARLPTEARKAKTAKADADETDLRVATRTLDQMVKAVGEIGIARSRMSANLDIAKISMSGLAASLERMNEHLREVELEAEKQMFAGNESGAKISNFDALQMDRFTRLQELSRRVAEAQNDVLTQQQATLGAMRDMEEAVATQNVLMTNLSSNLDEIRQIRVSSVVPNFKRVVRAACRDTGKLGEIFFDADVEIDRGILAKITGPIEHILRNAVAHGIESPQQRSQVGKPEAGTIEFRAVQDGGEVVIEIRDDGRGIDASRVLAKAVERGLVKPGTRMTEDKVHELLFEPGFSTADNVSDIAGRGVGLDVVRSQVSAIGGRVDIASVSGKGTTFLLRLPSTLTVIAGASVTTNGHMYIVPVSFIDRLVRIPAKVLEDAYKSRKLIVKDAAGDTVEYDFCGLWQLVGAESSDSRPASRNSVLLMRGSRTAVHVDDIRPASEYVFRPMGPQVDTASGLIGSTINAAGNATLVIDPNRVTRNIKAMAVATGRGDDALTLMAKKTVKTPMVLIVDDSLTVRKVTSRLLKREGLRCMEAENGMQALEKIQEERPDVILMDIEMPVMNGYEATQAIRATAETKDLPIIMITSRVGESHRQRAFELGVNEYLGKPYNDSDLLEMIRKHAKVTEGWGR